MGEVVQWTEGLAAPEAANCDSLRQWQQAVATLAAAVVIALCVAWLDRKRAVRYTRSSHDGAAD